MIKMVKGITITTGTLHLDRDEGEEYETFKLYGEVKWQDIKCPVSILVDDLLGQFEGRKVEITIKAVEE